MLEAQASPRLQLVLLVWLVGTILFGKAFSYIHLGPLYITEFVLAALVFSNLSRLRWFDFFFFGLLGFYVLGGLWKGYPIFFVGKDLSILYNLLFLRFFPRDFNLNYVKYILLACVLDILLSSLNMMPEEKYKTAVVTLFLAQFFFHEVHSRNMPLLILFLAIVGFLVNFKTLVAISLVLPLVYIAGRLSRGEAYFKATVFGGVMVGCVFWVSSGGFMDFVIAAINMVAEIFDLTVRYANNTAVWRLVIWKNALTRLGEDGQLLFGTFPGHNFMDAQYLRANIELFGGSQLGVVRTGHNAIVQLLMKSGFVGFFSFILFMIYSLPKQLHYKSKSFIYFVLICALTADVLEVPSRGPLFYSLIVILQLVIQQKVVQLKTNMWRKPLRLQF